jgi:hypothetical protein
VSRTHFVILVIGLVGALFLSFLMKQALGIHQEQRRHPLSGELARVFGSRLEAEPKVEVSDVPHRAVVTIEPILGLTPQRLATEIGEYVWHRVHSQQPLESVEVVCRDVTNGKQTRFPVPRPDLVQSNWTKAAPGSKPLPGARPTPAK